MQFEYWHEGFAFIGVFLFVIGVPCFLTAWIGTKLIEQLGTWPSRSARLQMGICVQLFLVQVVSFIMLALVLHVFSN